MPSLKYPNKLPKLRKRKCVVCKNIFYKHISPSDIKSGRGKVCSKECKSILNGIQKTTGKYRKCIRCGKKFWHRPGEDRRGYKHKYCSKYCYIPTKKGKSISTDGYYVINGKKVHRMIMEKHIGRKLSFKEIVHHINFNKLDNRIENLQIVSRREHNKIHKNLTALS